MANGKKSVIPKGKKSVQAFVDEDKLPIIKEAFNKYRATKRGAGKDRREFTGELILKSLTK